MYNERVWSIRSIRCHTSRGTSRIRGTSPVEQVDSYRSRQGRHKSRGSTYESRIQELRHKSVHYRHMSRGRVEALVSTGVEAQVCTSRGTRRTSRGTRHTSRGTRHTSRGTRHTSRGTRESRHQVYKSRH